MRWCDVCEFQHVDPRDDRDSAWLSQLTSHRIGAHSDGRSSPDFICWSLGPFPLPSLFHQGPLIVY